jgi:hypothetical protein
VFDIVFDVVYIFDVLHCLLAFDICVFNEHIHQGTLFVLQIHLHILYMSFCSIIEFTTGYHAIKSVGTLTCRRYGSKCLMSM